MGNYQFFFKSAFFFAAGLVIFAALSGCERSRQAPANKVMSFAAFQLMESQAGEQKNPATNCSDTAQERLNGRSCLDLRQEFRYVVYVGNQIYCYWDEKKAETGIDYRNLANSLEEKITDAIGLQQYFVQILKPWAAAFHDGHVNAMAGDDLSKFQIVTTNIQLRVLAAGTDHEEVVVAQSKNPEIPTGSVILSINGQSVKEAITDHEYMQSGSTRRMRRFSAGARIMDTIGLEGINSPLIVEFRAPKSDAIKTTQVDRILELSLPPFGKKPETEPNGEARVQARILKNSIGYLKIDGFGGTRMEEVLDKAMQSLAGTNGLIIDVRENGGGDQSGNRVLRWLTDKTIVRYSISPRVSDFILQSRPEYFYKRIEMDGRYYEWSPLEVKPTDKIREGTYAGKPVVVLTSPRCFSACDTFSSALQTNGIAQIVGEGTGGGTGTPHVFELPNSNFKFRYSVVRGRNVKGEFIEGVGTLPDVLVEYSAADLTKDPTNDSQAQKAIEIILGRLGKSPSPGKDTSTAESQEPKNGTSNSPALSASATLRELMDLQLSEKYHE